MRDVGECNKRPGSPFFNRHTMDVRRHSNPVKLASRKGNLNNIHVRVMLTLLTTAMFFLHDALNDTLPCFWNWKVGKPLINLTLADATKIGKTSLLISISFRKTRILSFMSSMWAFFPNGKQRQVFSDDSTF